MSAASIVQILFAVLALGAVVTIVAAYQVARNKRHQVAEQAMARGGFTLRADPDAAFEGLKCSLADKSRWRRGKGVLILTERKIRYDEFMPTYRLEIPIKEIRAVDTSPTFLGKYRGRPILALHFNDTNGIASDVGFTVKDPDSWAIQIRKRLTR